MKITEAKLRKLIREKVVSEQLRLLVREELLREKRENERHELLREGFIDSIRDAFRREKSKSKDTSSSKETGELDSARDNFSKISEVCSGLAKEIASTAASLQTDLTSSEPWAEHVRGLVLGGMGSLTQMHSDMLMLTATFRKSSDTSMSPEDVAKLFQQAVGRVGERPKDVLKTSGKSSSKFAESFTHDSKLFGALSDSITSDVDALQNLLIPNDSGGNAIVFCNVLISGFTQGGVGSLGQLAKDTRLISELLASASKTIDTNPETKEKLSSMIVAKLGKATSAG